MRPINFIILKPIATFKCVLRLAKKKNTNYYSFLKLLQHGCEVKNVQRIIQKICKIPAGKSAKYSDNKSSNQFARIFTGERTLHV